MYRHPSSNEREETGSSDMTKLIPSLREKKRYLVLEVIGEINTKQAMNCLLVSFSRLFGIIELANAHLVEIKSKSKLLMISINRNYVLKAKAAITVAEEQMRSVGVSGVLKTAQKKYM